MCWFGGVTVDEYTRSDVPYRLTSSYVKKCQDDDPASDDAKASRKAESFRRATTLAPLLKDIKSFKHTALIHTRSSH